MKLSFIKPNIGRLEHSLYVDEARMEPLQIGVLAGLTPPDVEVVLYDDRLEEIPLDEKTDLVAITVETYTARRSYEIAAEYRKRGVPVVMGGMHATLLPGEVMEFADTIVTGDADAVWSELISDAKKSKLKPRYLSQGGIAQRQTVDVRRDIFKGKGYLPFSLMQFSRGCIYGCHYCATSAYFNQKHYRREIKAVIDEIERNHLSLVFFVDDNIVANHEIAKEFFRALIPLKIKWVSQASIDQTNDLELMDLMAKSGCLGNVIGFESINAASLKEMKKSPNLGRHSRFEEEIRILDDYGQQTWAAFTFGHDHDTPETIKETVDFTIQHKFTFAAYNILMPYPGTELYRQLESQGRLLYGGKWWLHPEYRFNHAAFVPAKMSADELTAACFAARSRFNSIPCLLSRLFARKTNMRTLGAVIRYLTFVPLFRRETFKKQGMLFGFTSWAVDKLKKIPPLQTG